MAIQAVVVAFGTSLSSLIVKDDVLGNGEQPSRSWSAVVSGEEFGFLEKIKEFSDSNVRLSFPRSYKILNC